MISRRNIRITVMQTLYSFDSSQEASTQKKLESIINEKFDQTKFLFHYILFFISELGKYAEFDAQQKSSNHLPTKDDLNIDTKISGNLIIQKTLENESFLKVFKSYPAQQYLDKELLKKIYSQLITTDRYLNYIELSAREVKSEKKILEFIFTELLLPNENFIQHLEEIFINWDDDADLMHALILNYFSKPDGFRFDQIISKDKTEFAHSLINTVIEKSEYTLSLIKPKLNNWDADRIASLDLIILQMGVCELLFFETIPTKVTINEYIDIAKEYSTPQSGQFVNGLLDNIHKELAADNKIHKKTFKNSTL